MKNKPKKPSGPGRPAIYASEGARKAATQKRMKAYYAKAEYKEKRRWRYHNDPVYRAACQERDRAANAARRAPLVEAYKASLLDAWSKRENYGSVRGSGKQSRLTFSVAEFSALILREPYRVYAWIRRGLFPPPMTPTDNHNLRVYTEAQAGRLVEAVAACLPTKVSRLLANNHAAILTFRKAMKG